MLSLMAIVDMLNVIMLSVVALANLDVQHCHAVKTLQLIFCKSNLLKGFATHSHAKYSFQKCVLFSNS